MVPASFGRLSTGKARNGSTRRPGPCGAGYNGRSSDMTSPLHREGTRDAFDQALSDHLRAVESLRGCKPQLARLAFDVRNAFAQGGKLLLFGNGGSAADAQHIAAEFTGRFMKERGGLPAIALTTDTSALTAIGNDFGFEHVFARQLEALARPGDVALGISTSGNSPNVLAGLSRMLEIGGSAWAFVGRDGGQVRNLLRANALVVPGETPRVQECHILLGHLLCALVEGA